MRASLARFIAPPRIHRLSTCLRTGTMTNRVDIQSFPNRLSMFIWVVDFYCLSPMKSLRPIIRMTLNEMGGAYD